MNTFRSLALAALAALSLAAAVTPAAEAQSSLRRDWAAPESGRHEDGSRDHDDSERVRPVRDIIDQVRRQVGGEFMAVEGLDRDSNPPVYRLRWRFDNERVEVLVVDATSGRVLHR